MTATDDVVANLANLQLDAEAMRTFGYQIVDAIVDQVSSLPNQPTAFPPIDRNTMDARMWGPAPEEPCNPEEVLAQVQRDILGNGHRNSHPRYFGYVPNPSNFV